MIIAKVIKNGIVIEAKGFESDGEAIDYVTRIYDCTFKGWTKKEYGELWWFTNGMKTEIEK